ncbi:MULTISPECIES: hypothetical protein [Paraburkholderia]|uniref:hypothetical protein n=1 Tax=Paraburkholderia TaxID=1822464 RepID=UPI0038BBF050
MTGCYASTICVTAYEVNRPGSLDRAVGISIGYLVSTLHARLLVASLVILIALDMLRARSSVLLAVSQWWLYEEDAGAAGRNLG